MNISLKLAHLMIIVNFVNIPIHHYNYVMLSGIFHLTIWAVPYQKYQQELSSEILFSWLWKMLAPCTSYNFYYLIRNLKLFFHFRVTGNPLICGPKASDNCSAVFPEPLSLPPNGLNCAYHVLEYFVCWFFFVISTKIDHIYFFSALWIHRSIRL